MADHSFLDWPFFEDRHRKLAEEVEAWAAALSAPLRHPRESGDPASGAMDSRFRGNDGRDRASEAISDVDAETRRLVGLLGAAGWLRHCVPSPYGEGLDVRTL